MSESYSVKAILSAQDKGFTSTLKNAVKSTESLASKIKDGFAFGVLTGAGQQAFSALTSGARNLVAEIDSSNAAWKTFGSNMEILGKTEKDIDDAKKALQEYAQQTVYSSSDMASTYAQLAAVGTKNTTKLVKGFGGLAAAAENPQQAMKTLSQQATQMAAKPTVAWADFKLMLEQTPAGIAAIAKEMGMSTSELVTAVQDGEISTKRFFDAITAAGNSPGFSKMAMEAKTVGAAMDGLKETLGNKLTPAFEVLSQKGIKAVNGIADKVAEIDGDKLATKLTKGIEKATPYWEMFKDVAGEVWDVLQKGGKFIDENRDAIKTALPYVVKFALGLKAFSIIKTIVPGVTGFTKAIGGLAAKGIGKVSGKLFGISKSQEAVGKSSAKSGKAMLTAAKSYALMGAAVLSISAGFALLAYSSVMLANSGGLAIGVMAGLVIGVGALSIGLLAMLKTISKTPAKTNAASNAMLKMGVAVLLISAGFALLAFTSIKLADAGGLAIGVMVGMVATVALLAVGAAALGTALTAGALGFVAFGAALLMAGVAAVLAATSLVILSAALPALTQYGLDGAVAILSLGGSLVVFGLGAAVAGVGCLALGAGLLVVGAAVLMLGTGILMLATGTIIAAGALAVMAAILPTIAEYGLQGAVAIVALGASLLAVGVGATAAGAGCIVLAAGLTLVGAAVLVTAAGMLLLSAGTLVLVAGLVGVGGALVLVTALLPATAAGAALAAGSLGLLTVSSLALSAAMVATTVTVVAFGVSAVAAGVGVVGFGLGMTGAAVGCVALGLALKGVKSSMKTISSTAKSTEKSLDSMTASVKVVESGLDALGSKAKSSMKKLTGAFDDAAGKAKTSGKKVGTGFADGMKSGLSPAPSAALQIVTKTTVVLMSGQASAYSAGAYISTGFANGMVSQLGRIRSAAAQMAAAADAAVRAKAKIHSPSRVATKLGNYWGGGYVNGLLDNVKAAWKAAEELVSIPTVATPKLAYAYDGDLSADYDYYRNSEYIIEVPVQVDGRTIAKVTAPYTQEELDKRQYRDRRKHGKAEEGKYV